MAKELRGKSTESARTKGNVGEGLEASEQFASSYPIKTATEAAIGKGLDKPLEGIGEKLVKTSEFLKRNATSGMAKKLMTDANAKQLAAEGVKVAAKTGASNVMKVVGKAVPAVGLWDTAMIPINAGIDAQADMKDRVYGQAAKNAKNPAYVAKMKANPNYDYDPEDWKQQPPAPRPHLDVLGNVLHATGLDKPIEHAVADIHNRLTAPGNMQMLDINKIPKSELKGFEFNGSKSSGQSGYGRKNWQ